ncbi:hypothetical protein [uncultured Tateyamaria sp.]|uniref:hypothetical protein n=1 Tax=uncultured Tateyamaria sp. TaxID=455651 RepID=UPI002612B816|nr:hypothetical protein [uncultured Tateyamaria sp.]
MTALTKYDRLEATGLWRANPDAQRREVVVSIGNATLVISDLNDRAITHWSLAAVERADTPAASANALFHPDGDPGETLELSPDEAEMITAIDTLRDAVARARPHPGRLRWLGVGLSMAAVAALGVFWLPGALVDHAMRVVPAVKQAEIGGALLARITRVSGAPCRTPEAQGALTALAGRTGAARVMILPGGVREALSLPGGTVLLNRALVEDFEEPDVAAGYVLVEEVRSTLTPPLRDLLDHAGTRATAMLLTTGEVPSAALDAYTEAQLSRPVTALSPDMVLPAFAQAEVRSTPYARARDISGEETLELIEADPMAQSAPNPIMPDRDWLQLQSICEG